MPGTTQIINSSDVELGVKIHDILTLIKKNERKKIIVNSGAKKLEVYKDDVLVWNGYVPVYGTTDIVIHNTGDEYIVAYKGLSLVNLLNQRRFANENDINSKTMLYFIPAIIIVGIFLWIFSRSRRV